MNMIQFIKFNAMCLFTDNPDMEYIELYKELEKISDEEIANETIIFCNRVKNEGILGAMEKTFFNTNSFLIWAFGKVEFEQLDDFEHINDLLRAWNERHGDKLFLDGMTPVITDMMKMAKIWREEASIIA